MGVAQQESCPLEYECRNMCEFHMFSVGGPGDHVEEAAQRGLVADLEDTEDGLYTFVNLCEAPMQRGLNVRASEAERFIETITGEPFDLIKSVKANAAMMDYINTREAIDEMSQLRTTEG